MSPYRDDSARGGQLDGGSTTEPPRFSRADMGAGDTGEASRSTSERPGRESSDDPSQGAENGASTESQTDQRLPDSGSGLPDEMATSAGAPNRDAFRHPQGAGGGAREMQGRNGRRHRRGRGRGPRRDQPPAAPAQVAVTAEVRGWFDPGRDGGHIRRANNSYLADNGDAFVPAGLVRQHGLRKADLIEAGVGTDPRGRQVVAEIRTINEKDPAEVSQRPEFNSLPASYPERKLYMETGRTAKSGPEITRRAIDLIAPIGYGQRALIVAPARAGKTTLLHSLTEGIAINHPNAVLLILLVDERPEEVSEAISWGVGEVVSSSFDQPAQRHVEVTDIVLERARRLVETGRDVVIVLDSLTRMARAHNTVERGSGRTLSGGLDATAMAKPKAFFGSARNIPQASGGGSLTIIATALVETGSRMDDVIFEEFKGTGNSEIKLDRGLAEKRIYPAIDIGTSGTRREEKLFRADQLDAVYTLRRGLSQMPSQSAMEWLIKRIMATPNNDQLLSGL